MCSWYRLFITTTRNELYILYILPREIALSVTDLMRPDFNFLRGSTCHFRYTWRLFCYGNNIAFGISGKDAPHLFIARLTGDSLAFTVADNFFNDPGQYGALAKRRIYSSLPLPCCRTGTRRNVHSSGSAEYYWVVPCFYSAVPATGLYGQILRSQSTIGRFN